MEEAKEVRQIPIVDIIPNRFQPRINFDEKALNDLANSIKQHGIIQPLVVRALGDKFEIIAGERRYKAATIAGLSTVPAIVTQMDDDTSAEVALVENVQRKDLTSIEEAKSYKTMLERGNMTQEELAKKMGLSQSTIANKLRLLNLSNEVQDALLNEKISERHARALLSLPNKEDQVRWLDRIINERLTVRQLDLAIKDEQTEKNPTVVQPIENDVPIVNINPDIDQIINNAVDINPVDDKPKIDLFNGISPIQEDINPVEAPQNSFVEPVQEEKIDDKMPNKFFNFLEDQEVNMNIEDDSKNQTPEVPQTQNNGMDTFSFKPEFESTEVPAENQENVIEQPVVQEPVQNDDVFNQYVQEPIQTTEFTAPSDSIFMPDVNSGNESPEELIYQENNVTVPDNQNDVDTFNPFVSSPEVEIQPQSVEVNNDTIIDPTLNNIDNTVVNEPVQNQFFNVEMPSVPEENNIPVAPDTNAIEPQVQSEQVVNIEPVTSVEPIPVMSGENVVDPVTYYDTLDPQFIDKIKEIEGLDLKTAINEYRNITSILSSRGFNISIDEADEENKYHIVIDIDK